MFGLMRVLYDDLNEEEEVWAWLSPLNPRLAWVRSTWGAGQLLPDLTWPNGAMKVWAAPICHLLSLERKRPYVRFYTCRDQWIMVWLMTGFLIIVDLQKTLHIVCHTTLFPTKDSLYSELTKAMGLCSIIRWSLHVPHHPEAGGFIKRPTEDLLMVPDRINIL